MAWRVSGSANAHMMLTLLGTVAVRSHPATGAFPWSPASILGSPSSRPLAGSRRSLMRPRT